MNKKILFLLVAVLIGSMTFVNAKINYIPLYIVDTQVRFLLTEDVVNAHITITDMGGRLVTKVPVSPSDTSVTISSGALADGIYQCTLFANGQNVGTKRLVKTK